MYIFPLVSLFLTPILLLILFGMWHLQGPQETCSSPDTWSWWYSCFWSSLSVAPFCTNRVIRNLNQGFTCKAKWSPDPILGTDMSTGPWSHLQHSCWHCVLTKAKWMSDWIKTMQMEENMCFTLHTDFYFLFFGLPVFVFSSSLQIVLWSGKTTFRPSSAPHLQQSVIIAMAYGDKA